MIFDLILTPLALGLLCSFVAAITGVRAIVGVAIALSVVLLFLLFWGVPPLPAISSKHKIIYLLLAVAIAAAWVPQRSRLTQICTALAIGAAAFLWLNWRRFTGGFPAEAAVLSALSLACVAYGIWKSAPEKEQPFLWPAGQVVAVLGLGFVGLLSGYLGLGQAASGVAVFFGGVLLLPYLSILLRRPLPVPYAFTWVCFAVLEVLAIGMASFATNLHPLAFLFLLIALLSPRLAAQFPDLRSEPLRPFLFAAFALPWTGAGILTAFLHF